MKVYPKQSSGCLTVSTSAGAVDRKTYRKWVWTFINIVANLVNMVVSNHNVRMAQIVVCLMMIPCDSATGPILASIRKCKKRIGKSLSTPILTPPPPPPPPQLQIDFKSRLGPTL